MSVQMTFIKHCAEHFQTQSARLSATVSMHGDTAATPVKPTSEQAVYSMLVNHQICVYHLMLVI